MTMTKIPTGRELADLMKQAIELMSKHPGVRLGGPFEIRPADAEIDALIAARQA